VVAVMGSRAIQGRAAEAGAVGRSLNLQRTVVLDKVEVCRGNGAEGQPRLRTTETAFRKLREQDGGAPN